MICRTFAISREWAYDILSGEETSSSLRLDALWGLISISGNSESHLIDEIDTLHPPKYLVDSLFLSFDDVVPLFGETDDAFVYFDANMAERIISFLENVENKVETVIVNCSAGVSRSTAVCRFIIEKYGLDNAQFMKDHPYARPNSLV